jgi:hypothetical protein
MDAGVKFDETGAGPATQRRKVTMLSVIIMALARKTVAQLLELGGNLITNLTGNADFNDAAITAKLTEITNRGAALSAAQAELVQLQSDVAAKELDVQNLAADYKVSLNQLANLCEGKTNDPVKLATAGFGIRGQSEPVGDMPQPSVVKATRGDAEGEIDVTTPSIRGARVYICETSSNATGPFTRQHEGTRSTFTIAGAPAGAICHLRVAALGPKGLGPWSNVVSCRAA